MKIFNARPFVLLLVFVTAACGAPQPSAPDVPRPAEDDLLAFARDQTGEFYYGIYFSGKKIGWRVLRVFMEGDGADRTLVFDDETLFTMSLNGQVLKNSSRSRCAYSLAAPGPITSCVKQELSNHDFSTTTVTLKAGQHAVNINYNGQIRDYLVPPSRDTVAMAKAMDDWIFGARRPGDTFELFGIAVDGLRNGHPSIDSTSRVTYMGRRGIRRDGKRVDVIQVKSLEESGIQTRFELLPEGVALRIQAGPLEFRLEDENVVTAFETSNLDVAQTIPSNVRLGDPRAIASLELVLKTREPFTVPETRRQRVIKANDHQARLELLPEHLVDGGAPLSAAEKRKYTAATLMIPSDHEDIVSQGRAIVGDETDPIRMADRLQGWVYRNIRKTYGSDTGSALSVLENRSGDCTELSLLFTALARSVGLPARELTGLIYDDLNNVFGWHAWAEIHNGRQWISVDPTWNELFVNATHIRLSKDDEDLAPIALLNQLEIEVKSFKKK